MAKPVAARNRHHQVVQELGRLIVGGELAPGEGLPREELLAERMQVSRTALREAMKVLSAKGLIASRQRTGARVREAVHWNQLDADVLAWRCAALPAESLVDDLMEMRELIEPAAAAAAARRRTSAQLAALGAAYQAMAGAQDIEAWNEANLAFHGALLRAANNELMVSLFAVIESALETCFRLSAGDAGDFKATLPGHASVYEAVRARRPELARQAVLRLANGLRDSVRGRPLDAAARRGKAAVRPAGRTGRRRGPGA